MQDTGNQKDESFVTDDLSLAVFLSYRDNSVTIRWNGLVCEYVFLDTEEMRGHIAQYVNGDATVEPRQYNMAFSTMKSKMFNDPNAPKRNQRVGSRR